MNSCRDVFERDISNETVLLTSPNDNFITENTNVKFYWKEVEDASHYQVQIVSPRFDTINTQYLDTTLSSFQLIYTLNPGVYQWRVKAKNNAYESNFSSIYNIKIDSSFNLNNQTILLYSPATNSFFNHSNLTFNWQSLYSAQGYNIEVRLGSTWLSGAAVVDENTTTSTFTNTTSLTEGTYYWSALAFNTFPSTTPFAAEHKFSIDMTAPQKPVLISPSTATMGLVEDSLLLFNWTRPADVGLVQSPLFDSIYFYTDTLILPFAKHYSATEDRTIALPATGTYFWRVKSFDNAGNAGIESKANRFDVQ
jgi:hypothetical protein